MKSLIGFFAVCGLIVGCSGGYVWSKPGMTEASRDVDLMSCGTRNSHLEKDDPAAVAVIDQCMASRGYEKTRR